MRHGGEPLVRTGATNRRTRADGPGLFRDVTHVATHHRVEAIRRYQKSTSGLAYDLSRAVVRLRKTLDADSQVQCVEHEPSQNRLHRVRRRLTPNQVAQLVADYQTGAPSTELMERYQLGKGTVLRILDDNGVTRRRQAMTADQAADAIALYLSGWSLAKVGRHFGREHTAIRDVLERAGIPRRDSHGRDRQTRR